MGGTRYNNKKPYSQIRVGYRSSQIQRDMLTSYYLCVLMMNPQAPKFIQVIKPPINNLASQFAQSHCDQHDLKSFGVHIRTNQPLSPDLESTTLFLFLDSVSTEVSASAKLFKDN